MSFPDIKISLDTSRDDLRKELYSPCLKWADRFDRGVGYFTSGWLDYNLAGMSDFASRGGKMRLITSPILSDADVAAIINANEQDGTAYKQFESALLNGLDEIKAEMQKDVFNAFSWMLHDGIIDLRFAIPCKKLDDGDFHAKFGIFYSGDNAISYSGSINDSRHGFQNFETIMVFRTWAGTKEYVEVEVDRFERIWTRKDSNLRVYTIPQAVKEKIFEMRTAGRPYTKSKRSNDKWAHQDKAVESFLEHKHGILAMATGTGKTITAIRIINRLFEEEKIHRVVITMYGNDLLDQWATQLREQFQAKQIDYHYGSKKMMNSFIMHPDDALLLISRDSGNLSRLLELLDKAPRDFTNDTLFVFDEVHGAGSATLVENLTGRISPFQYRLGLSATPEREYDDEGNDFLLNEIGPVVFEFSLKDAIRKGILCEFNYIPLPYTLSDSEKQKKKRIIAAFNAQKKAGMPCNERDLFTKLAYINKTAIDKIHRFDTYIATNKELLEKCIIFVESKDYGLLLQEVLMKYTDRYHTYYAADEKINLENFVAGKISCLLTCEKISEGIDISSVTNIFLFASDRSRLVTTQRIGRALRLDKSNLNKVANVIDFVVEDKGEDDKNADVERKFWLSELAKTRRDTNNEE